MLTSMLRTRFAQFVLLTVGVMLGAIVLAVVLNGSEDDRGGDLVVGAPDASSSVDEPVDAESQVEGAESEGEGGDTDLGSDPAEQPEPEVAETESETPANSDTELEADEAGGADAPGTDEPDEAEAGEPGPEAEVGVDPVVEVSPGVIRQGETVFVRLSKVEVGSVLLTVDGETTAMVAEGASWVGFVPVLPLSDLGSYTVILDLFDEAGAYQETILESFQVVDAGVPVESITLLPGDDALLAPGLVAIDINVRFVENAFVSGPRLWTGPWIRPLPGNDTGIFGALRSFNGAPPTDWHHGHDLDGEAGDPIVAAATGRVVFAGDLPVHGIGVILDHGAGVFSGYWHMSASEIVEGTLVQAGDVLGLVGSTGLAVGPHLHWEVIVHGRDVDPIQWLDASLHP